MTATDDNKIQQHVPNSYCVLGVNQCCGAAHYEEPELYRGDQPVKNFLEKVIKKGETFVTKQKKPITITETEQLNFAYVKLCKICQEKLRSDRVRDHCHQCGLFRGAAHSSCNTKLYETKDVTVLFHNLRRYDGHLIMQELGQVAKEKGLSLECVPKGIEDYLSFTINLKSQGRRWRLRFVDSLAFLNAPLDELASNLPPEKFEALTRFSGHPELVKQKGYYPYDFMDGPEKFSLNELPSPGAFYNKLKMEPISEPSYSHAQKVWTKYGLQNMGRYYDLYFKTDVFLLADVSLSFRDFSMGSFGLDPAHYITLPSFAWDALLKYTGVNLELQQDPDMYQFSRRVSRAASVLYHIAMPRLIILSSLATIPPSPTPSLCIWTLIIFMDGQ